MKLVLLLYFLIGLILFLLPKSISKRNFFLISLLQITTFTYFASKLPSILNKNVIVSVNDWIPELGLNFEFMLDGLSLVFVLLITGIGTLVFLYSGAYMKSYEGTTKFYFYLTIFTGAMLGLVLSSNLIQLFIFWELTSFISFLLISFFHEKEASRKAAFQSLFITGFGGLALLAGIILIGSIVDSYSFNDWLANAEQIKQHHLYFPGLILIFLGVFTKSAQFPFHFWLPGAMQAPTPVSSYLHSATMVKAGIFLLARLNPVLGGTTEWVYILPVVGAMTMLTGAYFAITQKDLKAVLAYTTISALGTMVLLLGTDTLYSVKAALVFLIVHALYKATLFMIAGTIDKKTGTRDIYQLGGLRNYMPFTFIIAALAALSMAGLPPMLGFLGKELIYEAKVQSPGIASLILILGVLSNILMVAASAYVFYRVFINRDSSMPKTPNEKNLLFFIGPAVLALASLVFGLFPNILGENIVEPALRGVVSESVDIKLKIWHGFNKVFFLSLFTVIIGVSIAMTLIFKPGVTKTWRWLNQKIFTIHFSDVFTKTVERFTVISAKKTKLIQHGFHRYYILTIFLVTFVLLGIQLYFTWGWKINTEFSFRPFYISGLILIMAIAVFYSTISASRITTIISMGVVGYGISLIYLYYSAIDLAITQILVETLTVVLFVLVLQKLPLFAKLSSRSTRIRDMFIALGFGGMMTILALKAANLEINRPISDYFLENSYIKAFGKNVVNVILVDFRALDTLGEVMVLIIAALGVFTLIKTKTKKI